LIHGELRSFLTLVGAATANKNAVFSVKMNNFRSLTDKLPVIRTANDENEWADEKKKVAADAAAVVAAVAAASQSS
jgi:hypothetical protein